MMFDERKDCNLAKIDEILEAGLILKPISVIDGTGYEKFKVNLSESEIKYLVEENNNSPIFLPYKDKKLIEFKK